MEIRSFGENAVPKITEGRMIEGYAIVFNRESRVMFDWGNGRFFVERIKADAITPELLKKSDIKMLVEHNRNRLLARCLNGVGSLELKIDAYGLQYRFEAPATYEGDNAIALIQRGDIFGSSFAFTTDETANVKYTKRADGTLLREVAKIDRLFDTSIVSDPAYAGTKVEVRGYESFLDNSHEEDYKNDIQELRSLIKN
jgi:HK97 family phage prohead protease